MPLFPRHRRGGLLGALLGMTLMAAQPMAALGERGAPFLRLYTGREYGALYQNWSVVQDSRGILYAGNNLGVLEFDGVRWRLIRSPRGTAARALALDEDGSVLAAFPGEVGKLVPDPKAELTFSSRLDRLAPEERGFLDVRSLCVIGRSHFLLTSGQLFEFGPTAVHTWFSAAGFIRAFTAWNTLYVQERGRGLLRLEAGILRSVEGAAHFAQDPIVGLIPWQRTRSLLLATERNGLFFHDGSHVAPFPTSKDSMLRQGQLTSLVQLGDGTLAVGTRTAGLFHFDAEGRPLGGLLPGKGLPDTAIHHLAKDAQGGLWMALGKGLCRVELPSALSRFDEHLGLRGAIFAVHRHGETLYVGTDQGIFRLVPGRPDGAHFKLLRGVPGNAWAFLSTPHGLLASAQDRLFLVKGERAAQVWQAPAHIYGLFASSAAPGRIHVGLARGLVTLQREGDHWREVSRWPTVAVQVRTVVEEPNGSLWLGTSSSGVLRVSADGIVQTFGLEAGLPSLKFTNVFPLSMGMRVATEQGIYRFSDAKGRFEPDPAFQDLFPQGPRWVYALREGPGGRIWMHSFDMERGLHASGAAVAAVGGRFRWDGQSCLRFAGTWVEDLFVDVDGVVWFGGREGLVRLEPNTPLQEAQSFPARIRRVSAGAGRLLFGGADGTSSEPVRMPHRDRRIRFEFSQPGSLPEGQARFEVLLEGYDRSWSSPSTEPYREYTNLPAGRYRFRVRRAEAGEGQEAAFVFNVLPPWYRAWWAWMLYVIASAAALRTGFRWRLATLHARNAQLEERIRSRTQDLQLRTAELFALNEQKNHFLGVVVHDLRSPLNGIVLAAQLLEDEDDLAEVGPLARRIAQEGLEMSTLIGRFLDIAALEAGALSPEAERVDLNLIIRHIVRRHAPRAEQKCIRIIVEGGDEPVWVWADPKFLKEALDNLLSNAVKFSPAETTTLVRISHTVSDRVRVSIQDQGPGLKAEEMARLFSRYARLSAKPTGGEKSIGLGLSIVKSLVEAMDGRIWAESILGEGATFHVELPTEKEPDHAADAGGPVQELQS